MIHESRSTLESAIAKAGTDLRTSLIDDLVYTDAGTGRRLGVTHNVMTDAGTGKTLYSGKVALTVKKSGAKYTLVDSTRIVVSDRWRARSARLRP